MKKLILSVLFIAVAAGMTWLVWLRPVPEPGEEKKPEADVPVRTGTIIRTNLRAYITAYGVVEPEPKASARVSPATPGIISSVQCSEGQHVEKGDILFGLDSRTVDVAVTFAEKTLERQQRLSKVEGTSQKLLQESEQALAAAKAQQALLQTRSPLSGTVTKINSKAGEAADLTTILAEIIDLDRLVVSASLPSADMTAVRVGQSAQTFLASSTNATETPLVYVSAQVDPKTGAVMVRASIPVSSGLSPGQFVRLRIISAEHKDCLAVPTVSVAKDAAGGTFLALVEDGKAVLKPVKTGLRDGDWVEVMGEGVAADSTVVTEGAYGIIMTQQFATKIRVMND